MGLISHAGLDGDMVQVYIFSAQVYHEMNDKENVVPRLRQFLNFVATQPSFWKVVIFASQNNGNNDEILNLFDRYEYEEVSSDDDAIIEE